MDVFSVSCECDAVITWVDGSDPVHAGKLKAFLPKNLDFFEKESVSSTRFSAVGELDYCVSAIFEFAPWIRKIFIVTDQQVPPLLACLKGTAFESRVSLVFHQDIFFQEEQAFLPTFNSLSIESVLWRIPGLSEQFIYFNDDCILIRPVCFEDFFDQGRVVIRGRWKWQRHGSDFFRFLQETTARLLGYRYLFFGLGHLPFPLNMTMFRNSFETYGALFHMNIQYRFRNECQFIPISFLQYQWLREGCYRRDKKKRGVTVHASFHSVKKIQNRLKYAEKNPNIFCICFQSIDEGNAQLRDIIFSWLEHRIKKLF